MTPFCTELTGITEETLASAGDGWWGLVGLKRVALGTRLGVGTELGVGDGFIFFQLPCGSGSWQAILGRSHFPLKVGGTVNWVNLFLLHVYLRPRCAGSLADALEGLQRDLNDEQICGRRVDGTSGSVAVFQRLRCCLKMPKTLLERHRAL